MLKVIRNIGCRCGISVDFEIAGVVGVTWDLVDF